MSDHDWSPELTEWVYGPPSDEDDEPESVGEMYRRQEEEERILWLPGYRDLVERYLAALAAWHRSWVPGTDYPPEPDEVTAMKLRLSEWQKIRVDIYNLPK